MSAVCVVDGQGKAWLLTSVKIPAAFSVSVVAERIELVIASQFANDSLLSCLY